MGLLAMDGGWGLGSDWLKDRAGSRGKAERLVCRTGYGVCSLSLQ